MSAFCQFTDEDHDGGVEEEVTVDQSDGSPEREIEVTDQPLWQAMRQIREPAGEFGINIVHSHERRKGMSAYQGIHYHHRLQASLPLELGYCIGVMHQQQQDIAQA